MAVRLRRCWCVGVLVCWWCCVRSWCVGGAACGLKKSTDTDRCLLLPRYVRILPCLVNLLGYVLPLLFVLYVAGKLCASTHSAKTKDEVAADVGGEGESERERKGTNTTLETILTVPRELPPNACGGGWHNPRWRFPLLVRA